MLAAMKTGITQAIKLIYASQENYRSPFGAADDQHFTKTPFTPATNPVACSTIFLHLVHRWVL